MLAVSGTYPTRMSPETGSICMDRMRTPHRSVHRSVLVLLSVAAFASCSSSGDLGSTVSSDTDGGSAVDHTTQDSATTELAAEASSRPAAGSCVVSSVGAVSISFSSPGGPSAVSSDYWLPEGGVSPLEAIALIATCTGVDGTVVSFSAESDVLQFAPGTYDLRPDQIGIFLPNAILQPVSPVPMTLTRFDSARITGSMVFDASDSDGMTSNFRIDFDLANPMLG